MPQLCYTISSMEFETNTQDSSPYVSDAQRLAASGKRVTLAPLHDIARDDEQIVIRPREDVPATVQVSEPNVYIPSESEDTSTIHVDNSTVASVAGIPTRPVHRISVFVALGLFAAITGTIIFLMTTN